MKRLVVFSLFLISLINYSFADDGMKLTKGSIDVFKEDVTANVIFDWSKAIIHKTNLNAEQYFTQKGEENMNSWVEDVEHSQASFCEFFNVKKFPSTKMILTQEPGDYKYTLKIKINSINLGKNFTIGFRLKSGGLLMLGDMELIDNTTGESVATFDLYKIKGVGINSIRVRLISACRYLAQGLIRTIGE